MNLTTKCYTYYQTSRFCFQTLIYNKKKWISGDIIKSETTVAQYWYTQFCNALQQSYYNHKMYIPYLYEPQFSLLNYFSIACIT